MLNAIRIRENDDVAVALKDIEAGTVLDPEPSVITREPITHGHKIALHSIRAGEPIIKYGFPIGKALRDIAPGEHVHIHNMHTNLAEHEDYLYTPDIKQLPPQPAEFFMGYRRPDGRVGIRNELWIIPGVGCVADLAERLARAHQHLAEEYHLDGIYALTHQFGCSQLGDDNTMTREFLARLVNHPNAGGVLVLSLGCENNIPADFQKSIVAAAGEQWNEERVRFLVTQDVEDEEAVAAQLLRELAQYAGTFKREPVPVSELVLGMKCGGSDGLSGITANPLLGCVGDMLIARGGSSMITEVPEMFGAEKMLLCRCVDDTVYRAAVSMLDMYKDYFIRHGMPVYENPAPGNYTGGISSLEDKSLGCVQKGGTAPVVDVIPYGGQIRRKGLTLLGGPGSDMVSAPNLAAAGAHIVIFTTGRGTPYSTAVPTIKVSTNSEMFARKSNWIDYNAGAIAEGKSLKEAAQELYDMVIAVASGEQLTKGEELGYRKISIFKNGVTV